MKCIIAGSRGITDYGELLKAVNESNFFFDEVVSGGAHGVDQMGEQLAKRRHLKITRFIPDWEGIGRSAGFRRNEEMARYASALIALHDGNSSGTRHMIQTARDQGLKVFVRVVEVVT